MGLFTLTRKKEYQALLPIFAAWANSVELRSLFFKHHSYRVGKLAEILGKAVKFPDLEKLFLAGLLHDVGMIIVPEEILFKPDSLAENEWGIVRKHPLVAQSLISSISDIKEISTWIIEHHEAFNGRGYPHGKIGEEISLGGRILAICEAYDALTSERPQRVAYTPDQAKEILLQHAGIQWDTKLVKVAIEHFPPRILDTDWESPYHEIFDSHMRSRYEEWRKTSLLVKIGESFRVLTHPPAYGRKLLEIIRTAFPAFGGYLFTTVRADRFVVRATDGFTFLEDFEGFEREHPFFQTSMARGAVPFLSVDEKNPFFSIIQQNQFTGMIFLPLTFFERWLGFLVFFLRPGQGIRSEDIQFFETVSHFVSASLDSVLMIEAFGENTISDPVTRAYTWRIFNLKFHEEVARAKRNNEKFSIVLILYPEYNRLRTQFSEQVAEAALVELAKTLQSNLRASDIVARFEENNFLLLLPTTALINARIAVKRLQGAFMGRGIYAGERASSALTFQHGVATFPDDGYSLKDLMAKARLRLQV